MEITPFTGSLTPPESVIPPEIDLSDAIGMGVNALFLFLGSMALLGVITGGIFWSLSLGDEEKIGRAKRILFSSLIGLILSLSSWGIASILFGLFG